MLKYLATLLLILMFTFHGTHVYAQGDRAPGNRIVRYGNLVYAEAASFPSDSVGMSRIDVFIRVAYDFLVFKKSGIMHTDSTFMARLEYAISLENRDGVFTENGSGTVVVYAGDYDATNTRDHYVLGLRTFYTQAGMFTVRLQLQDGNSTLERRVALPVKAVDFASPSLHIGGIVPLVVSGDDGPETPEVAGFSRSLNYAEVTTVAVPASLDSNVHWRFRITKMDREDSDEPLTEVAVVKEFDLQPLRVLHGYRPEGSSGVRTSFPLMYDSSAAGAVYLFDLPLQSLDIGTYRIDVFARHGEEQDSTRQMTRVFWREMPWSLNDLDYAIFILRYIMTEEEYERMREGSESEKREKFKEFWKRRDPTPDTEHNEAMFEYYRRVDEAYFKFRTLYVRDGADTDRGKIYILFGPPDDVKRLFEDDEMVQEVWSYPSLNKTFRFLDKHRDRNLILVK
jgi:GWxTD domain-containing protein